MIDPKARWVSSLLRLLLAFLIVSGQVVFAAVTPISVTAQNSISDEVLDELIVGLTTEAMLRPPMYTVVLVER